MPRTVIDSSNLPLKVSVAPLGDPAETMIITVIQSGLNPARSKSYLMGKDGAVGVLPYSTEVLGKDDTAVLVGYTDGTLRLIAIEADPVPNSSGTTSKLVSYDFPGALQPFPPSGSATDQEARAMIADLYVEIADLNSKLQQIKNIL